MDPVADKHSREDRSPVVANSEVIPRGIMQSCAARGTHSGLGALDQGHHFGGVALTDDGNLVETSGDIVEIVGSQVDMARSHVLFEVGHTLGAGNGNDVFALSQDPGESQQRRSDATSVGQFLNGVCQFEVGLEGLFGKAWIVFAAPVGGIEVVDFLDRAGEEAAAEWAVRDEGNAELAARGEYTVGFDIAGPQRVFALQSGDGMDLSGVSDPEFGLCRL